MPVSVDSPCKHSPSKRCDCQYEILSLKSAVANLEHWCGSMRDDITSLKSEAARKQSEFDKNIQAMLGHHGDTQNVEQLMEELSWQKNYKKGTSRAFRMLFSPEETIGRSLNGQGSMWGMRPALEDRGKLKFLEDCVKEQWVECSTDQIRSVIRHHLKPSRNGKKTIPELENSALEELDESIDSYFV